MITRRYLWFTPIVAQAGCYRHGARNFRFGGHFQGTGARAFSADINHMRTRRDHTLRLRQRTRRTRHHRDLRAAVLFHLQSD